MTITPFLPQWLRRRSTKPLLPKPANLRKKDWQILPTLPKPQRPRSLLQDNDCPPGRKIRWHP